MQETDPHGPAVAFEARGSGGRPGGNPELLDASGAEPYGCKMAMDMFGLTNDDLVPEVKEAITAMEFFEKSEGAQTNFV